MSLLARVVSMSSLGAAAVAQPLVDVQVDGQQITMTAIADGTVLMDPRGLTIHDGMGEEVIEPEIDIVPQPDGFDVTYTFTNDTNKAMPLGRLKLGIFPIGQEITYREFRWFGTELTAEAEGYNGMSIRYPLSLYSPVHVIQNDDYAIGVSLQYPVLDYKHDFTLSMVSPGGSMAEGPGGKGWAVIYKMNHNGTEGDHIKMEYTASLKPGETNVYTVSVRVTDKPDEWMRTLLPYREYFHELYGGVRYERDPSPIFGMIAAGHEGANEDNPDGWTNPNTLRPDEFGWLPWIEWMFERDNWSRMMMWFPGGAYDYDRFEPFDFVTNWHTNPFLMQAIDPKLGFQLVEDAGRRFGLWWSQSVNYSESFGNLVGFDLDNPAHIEAALIELDLAVASGATMIGLDTFTHKKCAIWEQYKWIQIMQARHPHVTYVIEPITMDFMHTLAPAFYTGHNDLLGLPPDFEDLWAFKGPHLLADFLNPGHEIWGAWRYWAYQFYGVEYSPETAYEDMQKIAEYGLAPLIITGMDLDPPQRYDAAETWLETVPDDLLYFAPPLEGETPIDIDGKCIVDMDGSGTLSVLDFVIFYNAFNDGDMIADMNADGVLNVFDFIMFQDLFDAGC